MQFGFTPQCEVKLPQWAHTLANQYFHIRMARRNKSLAMRYYRYVAVEKLRLVELGIKQELVLMVCRYLSGFNRQVGIKLVHLLNFTDKQLCFDFT